jgi:hypothetical protein
MAKSPGYLDVSGKIYRFDSVTCHFSDGFLYVDADGARCRMHLVGVPFPEVKEISELAGRRWQPDYDDMSAHADVFAEGGIEIRGERFSPYEVRIECKSFNAEARVLKLEVEFRGEAEESGYSGTIDGWLACEVKDE